MKARFLEVISVGVESNPFGLQNDAAYWFKLEGLYRVDAV